MIRRIAVLLCVLSLSFPVLASESSLPRDPAQPLVGRWKRVDQEFIIDFRADGASRTYTTFTDPTIAEENAPPPDVKWTLGPDGMLELEGAKPDGGRKSERFRVSFDGDDAMKMSQAMGDGYDRALIRFRRFDAPLPEGYHP